MANKIENCSSADRLEKVSKAWEGIQMTPDDVHDWKTKVNVIQRHNQSQDHYEGYEM